MWELPDGSAAPRVFVIAQLRAEAGEQTRDAPYLTALPQERLIVHGDLLTPDEARPVGVASALQAPRRAVDAVLRAGEPGRAPLQGNG
jgi:hypothetical protein